MGEDMQWYSSEVQDIQRLKELHLNSTEIQRMKSEMCSHIWDCTQRINEERRKFEFSFVEDTTSRKQVIRLTVEEWLMGIYHTYLQEQHSITSTDQSKLNKKYVKTQNQIYFRQGDLQDEKELLEYTQGLSTVPKYDYMIFNDYLHR